MTLFLPCFFDLTWSIWSPSISQVVPAQVKKNGRTFMQVIKRTRTPDGGVREVWLVAIQWWERWGPLGFQIPWGASWSYELSFLTT